MKFCPKCGAQLKNEDAAFCTECGEQFSVSEAGAQNTSSTPKSTSRKAKKSKKKAKQKKQRKEKKPIPEVMAEAVEDDYDGYYNDVLPPDLDREKEGMDRKLIKNIVFLGIAFLGIIGLCVAMLYVL